MWRSDFEMDDGLTCAFVAESTGARRSLVVRLAKQGLLETVSEQENETGEPVLTRRTIMQLRRMQRLRRDLGVNFAGAAIVLDLVERIEQLNQELAAVRAREMSDEL